MQNSSLGQKTKRLLKLFDELNIVYQNHFHEPAFTVEELRHLHDVIPGGHGKSLFLTNKKEQFFLVLIHCDDKVDLKMLSKMLNQGSLSFASSEKLKEILDLTPGSVTPFAIIHDLSQKVQVVMDKKLGDYELLSYHPLRNDISTTIKASDLLKFLKTHHHEPVILEIPIRK